VTAPFGLTVLFFNVLLQQLGLPVPVVPTLVVAGALAADGQLPLPGVYALALAACLIGDSTWYTAGRIYGMRVMRLLCRISLTPDTCVRQTQTSFERHGPLALVVAKFIPGLRMIAPPLAGATRMNFARFAGLSLLGSSLWVGAALVAGVLLRPEIARLLPRLAGLEGVLVVLLLVLLAAYIALKWRERRRFYAALDMARISVEELYARMQGEPAPVIVDVRSATALGLEGRRIPGALHVPLHEVAQHLSGLPRDREIVLYCNCPNEASAAQAARLLRDYGFPRVHPLHGGLDAWIAAGYAVEEITAGRADAPNTAAAAGSGDVDPA